MKGFVVIRLTDVSQTASNRSWIGQVKCSYRGIRQV